jgi:6-phosphofructokinase
MVRGALGLKVHWSVLDYVQRAARHLASQTDLEQAYAVGGAALTYALQGKTGVMPVIKRIHDRPYRWRIVPASLAGLMNREKRLPRGFLTADGYRLTASARRYFAPLILGEAFQPYKDGLPLHAKLRLKPLARRLQSGWQLPSRVKN